MQRWQLENGLVLWSGFSPCSLGWRLRTLPQGCTPFVFIGIRKFWVDMVPFVVVEACKKACCCDSCLCL
jgi:hypothetical protein